MELEQTIDALAQSMTENEIIDMVIDALKVIRAVNDPGEKVCRCYAAGRIAVLALKWELMEKESKQLTPEEMIGQIRGILG